MVVLLWFVVAPLTDSFLEAIKACQGGNRDWKVIPLNNCKWIERVFIIISSGTELPVSKCMGSS